LQGKKSLEGRVSLPDQAGSFKREAAARPETAPFGIPIDTQICDYVGPSGRIACNYAETSDWAPEGSGAGPSAILGNMVAAVEQAGGKIEGRVGEGSLVAAQGMLADGRQLLMWMNGKHFIILVGSTQESLASLCKALPF
jgi:hypothetical protein